MNTLKLVQTDSGAFLIERTDGNGHLIGLFHLSGEEADISGEWATVASLGECDQDDIDAFDSAVRSALIGIAMDYGWTRALRETQSYKEHIGNTGRARLLLEKILPSARLLESAQIGSEYAEQLFGLGEHVRSYGNSDPIADGDYVFLKRKYGSVTADMENAYRDGFNATLADCEETASMAADLDETNRTLRVRL